ncbi:hypothetical protein ZWY2020_005871 [Hordeum vulgare]|nr:hypothetical protein ZWY2020_005871 [Hordeum vulgare]
MKWTSVEVCAAKKNNNIAHKVKRVTKGTDVHVKINLDGTGVANSSTGIPFLDHMLDQLASHGLFDVYVKVLGDIHIDDHHSNEDIALAIGTALLQALGDRKGINRFAHFTAPLDEAAVEVILDLSGRPHLSCGLSIPTERVGTYDTQLVLTDEGGARRGGGRLSRGRKPGQTSSESAPTRKAGETAAAGKGRWDRRASAAETRSSGRRAISPATPIGSSDPSASRPLLGLAGVFWMI